jgi:hypothetical protein
MAGSQQNAGPGQSSWQTLGPRGRRGPPSQSPAWGQLPFKSNRSRSFKSKAVQKNPRLRLERSRQVEVAERSPIIGWTSPSRSEILGALQIQSRLRIRDACIKSELSKGFIAIHRQMKLQARIADIYGVRFWSAPRFTADLLQTSGAFLEQPRTTTFSSVQAFLPRPSCAFPDPHCAPFSSLLSDSLRRWLPQVFALALLLSQQQPLLHPAAA